MPEPIKVLVVRVREENKHPDPALLLGAGDVLLLGSNDKIALETARNVIGEYAPGRVVDKCRCEFGTISKSKQSLSTADAE